MTQQACSISPYHADSVRHAIMRKKLPPPYPASWDDFIDLQEKARASKRWKKLARANELFIDRSEREIFKDSVAGVYYFVNNLEHPETFARMASDPTNPSRDKFFDACEARTHQEFKCYEDIGKLGFRGPETYRLLTNRDIVNLSPSSVIVIPEKLTFQSVLCLSEVKGLSVMQVMADRKIAGSKKQAIAQEFIEQAIAVGVAYADIDRMNDANVIVADLVQEKPEDLRHIDFEESNSEGEEERILLLLMGDLQERYDVLWTEKTIAPVTGRLRKALKTLEQNSADIGDAPYRGRLQKAADFLEGNKSRSDFDQHVRENFFLENKLFSSRPMLTPLPLWRVHGPSPLW